MPLDQCSKHTTHVIGKGKLTGQHALVIALVHLIWSDVRHSGAGVAPSGIDGSPL